MRKKNIQIPRQKKSYPYEKDVALEAVGGGRAPSRDSGKEKTSWSFLKRRNKERGKRHLLSKKKKGEIGEGKKETGLSAVEGGRVKRKT